MRNTFVSWVNTQHDGNKNVTLQQMDDQNPTHANFGVYNDRGDQEVFLTYPDGLEARISFRFLHGSELQYHYKTTNWNAVMISPTKARDDEKILKEIAKPAELATGILVNDRSLDSF